MAVGFEWQTTFQVYKNDALPAHGQPLKFFPKNTVLKQGQGWKIVTDGADMEFVLDHVPLDLESEKGLGMDGESTLRARLQSIKLFCESLDAHHAKAVITRTDAPVLLHSFPNPFIIVPHGAASMTGFVQVTGGIRLTKLRKFFKAIGTQDSQDAKDFLGQHHNSYSSVLRKVHLSKAQFADTTRMGHQPGPKFRSFVELVALYINQFKSPTATTPAKVIKYLTFVMSRTSFAKLFGEVENVDLLYYRNNPDAWVRYICVDIMSKIAGFNNVTGADPDDRLISYLIDDMGDLKGDKRIKLDLTRKQWLKAMVRGEDLLTAAAHPLGWNHPINKHRYADSFGNHRLRGLGALGDTMDTLAMNGLVDNQGAIFEFRGQQSNIPYTAWKDYSVRVYRFLQSANFGQQNV
jgi:hypothetical protein